MTIELTAIEELPTETRKIAIKALQFREANMTLRGHIEELGGNPETVNARLEHLLASLVHLGVITEQAMWEINLDWEKKLKPQLQTSLETHREIARQTIARQRELAQRATSSLLRGKEEDLL